MDKVRTRFAPSPTGYLHIGGIRTALFAYLLARHSSGQFILRFEDTDTKREVTGAKAHIIKSLKRLGLDWDEGPDIGGDYKPYQQSERLNIYLKWAKKLIEIGRAYPDPYKQSQIELFRAQAAAAKKPFLFRNHRPVEFMEWDVKSPLRFKSEPKDYAYTDLVMGKLSMPASAVDDFILIKSDGYPTYNFANVIDDFEMKISHVLRGQEYLASIPNYLNLHEALSLQPPNFATLPHVLNEAGNKKLSKRDNAKDILEYINEGYLPEALISFVATLGWNDGTEQELFTLDELVDKFDIAKVQRSGAKLDEKRLIWINGSFIRSLDLNELQARAEKYWPKEADGYSEDYKKAVLALFQDRLKYLGELADLSKLFFVDLPLNNDFIYNDKYLTKLPKEEIRQLLQVSLDKLKVDEFSEQSLTVTLNKLLELTSKKPAELFSLIRIAISRTPASPPLASTMALLGKDRSIKRIGEQLAGL